MLSTERLLTCRSPTPVPLFLPTLLLGLTDELPAVRTEALQQVDSVAAAYSEQQVRRKPQLRTGSWGPASFAGFSRRGLCYIGRACGNSCQW